jgi:hypothetical protein
MTACQAKVVSDVDVDKVEKALSGDGGTAEELPDNPSGVVELRFVHPTGESMWEDDLLRFEVTNPEPYELPVQLSLRFAGMFQEPVALELGTRVLPSSGKVDVTVPSSEIPLQTRYGACQVRAIGRYKVPSEDGTRSVEESSLELYYRFSMDWTRLALFEAQALRREMGGEVIPAIDGLFAASGAVNPVVLGRRIQDGQLVNATYNDVLCTKDEQGRVLGCTSGYGQGIGVDGAVIPVEEGGQP